MFVRTSATRRLRPRDDVYLILSIASTLLSLLPIARRSTEPRIALSLWTALCLWSLVRRVDVVGNFARWAYLGAGSIAFVEKSRMTLIIDLGLLIALVVFGYGAPPHRSCFASSSSPSSPKRGLRILVLTLGTRGDVEPFLALGEHMKTIYDDVVSISAFDEQRSSVESKGFTFYPAGISGLKQETSKWRNAQHVSEIMTLTLAEFASQFHVVATHFLRAVKDSRAELIVCTGVTLTFGLTLSEFFGVPVVCAKLAPDAPTRAYAPSHAQNESPFGIVHVLAWYDHWAKIAKAANISGLGDAENAFRRDFLKMKPVNGLKRAWSMFSLPTLYAFSDFLVPVGDDAWTNTLTTGPWLTHDSSTLVLSDFDVELDEFLNAKKENDVVVGITFGSMVRNVVESGEFDGIIKNLQKALNVHPNWKIVFLNDVDVGELARLKDRIYLRRDPIPHSVVFERCDLIVHHGGAGTTARAIRCRVPSVTYPVLAWTDQRFWGRRCEAVGVGVVARRPEELSSKIEVALRTIDEKTMSDAAKRFVDGTAVAARAIRALRVE